MNAHLHRLLVGACFLFASWGCNPAAPPIVAPPDAKPVVGDEQKQPAPGQPADLPDVITQDARGHGPQIKIWVNGELFVDMPLRDSEEVAADQLGNYLARIPFHSTKKVTIKPDDGDPRKASLKAKFELTLANRRGSSSPADPVLKMSFDEMRFARSVSDPDSWVLTTEGIELIEKALPQK